MQVCKPIRRQEIWNALGMHNRKNKRSGTQIQDTVGMHKKCTFIKFSNPDVCLNDSQCSVNIFFQHKSPKWFRLFEMQACAVLSRGAARGTSSCCSFSFGGLDWRVDCWRPLILWLCLQPTWQRPRGHLRSRLVEELRSHHSSSFFAGLRSENALQVRRSNLYCIFNSTSLSLLHRNPLATSSYGVDMELPNPWSGMCLVWIEGPYTMEFAKFELEPND